MSDINIILDGVIAFIAAACLSILFLLGLLIFSVYGWAGARRKGGRFIDEVSWPHLQGLLLGLLSSIAIMLLILFTDRMPRPHSLNGWLDKLVWLWVPAVLLLWPLGVYLRKKSKAEATHSKL
jgi:hypothetical protein